LADPIADDPPQGFEPLAPGFGFGGLIGPFYGREAGAKACRGFRVGSKHVNRLGIVHGGMLLSFADTLLGAALRLRLGARPAVTVKLSADLATAARLGDWVEGEAEVTRLGRSVAFVRGRVQVGRRTVLTAEGMFQLLAARKRVD